MATFFFKFFHFKLIEVYFAKKSSAILFHSEAKSRCEMVFRDDRNGRQHRVNPRDSRNRRSFRVHKCGPLVYVAMRRIAGKFVITDGELDSNQHLGLNESPATRETE